MEMIDHGIFVVHEAGDAGVVRRKASALAAELGARAEDAGRVALVATEAATNLVKHAGGGEILLYGGRRDDGWAVAVIAVDRGPGMRDVAACLQDGTSTAGSPGTGLGAIRRLATTFDLHTSPRGTVVFAEVRVEPRPARTARPFLVGAVRAPHPAEETCGDGWAVVPLSDERCMILLADGLGHGLAAADAAAEATRIFRARPSTGPDGILAMLHDALRATRGAAAAVAELDARTRTIRYAGVGNVTGWLHGAGRTHGMVSLHGTLGHHVHKIQEFRYPWPREALVCLHSDGLSARWDFATYPGLAARHPMVIAAVVYRDHRRRTDDASIVVVREAA